MEKNFYEVEQEKSDHVKRLIFLEILQGDVSALCEEGSRI